MTEEEKRQNQLKELLQTYSFDDLAKNFFILNLWLPNIASPIKIQYLYVILESIHEKLPTENKIKTYVDFEIFCKSIFELLPSFPMLEDYVPEADWKDVKYYFHKRFYKIFYGGDLSNPYDFYYAYEVIHEAFEEEYLDLTERSPITEMKYCLELQDYMLTSLNQEKTTDTDNIGPGDISVPSKNFWKAACKFIYQYNPETYNNSDFLKQYTKKNAKPAPNISMNSFVEKAYRGQNCQYFFIKKDKKYYPVMPRKWLSVIYDTWGAILKNNYGDLVKKLDKRTPNISIGARLGNFIRKRVTEDDIFLFARSVKSDMAVAHDLIFTAVRAKDKIFLTYVVPPNLDQDDINKHLKEIQPKLKKSIELLKQPPFRLGLMTEQKIVEFKSSKEGSKLKPVIIIALPYLLTSTMSSVKIPKDIEVEIMTIDQIVGIFDEIENEEELSNFFDYIDTERGFSRITPFNSYLDKLGSFRGSSEVLIPGAIEPDSIMLDFAWGSNLRFKSLKEFWDIYPEENFFGHPRSWFIPPSRKTKTGFILSSKTFFGYAYCQKMGKASFFINAPVHVMRREEGGTCDSIMYSLSDAFDICPQIIQRLRFTQSRNKVQIFLFPSSLVLNNDDFSHVKHLIQDDNLWSMDSTRIGPRDYAIRVVYDQEKMVDALRNITDRSIQINLLSDVLEELSKLTLEPDFSSIRDELGVEKGKKARFKTFAVQKTVSFPERFKEVLPKSKEYKLADKEIAKLALGLGIQPGTYSAKVAQEKLNSLRAKIVKDLNNKICQYSLPNNIPFLLEQANALINNAWLTKEEIKASLEHEVDYERDAKAAKEEKKFLHWHRTYRYLIEKFVQLQPSGTVELNNAELRKILAFTDRLLDLYVASDFINYQIYPVNANIDRDYIVSTSYQDSDISAMEKKYGEEQAKINLGLIGNKKDTIESDIATSDYWNDLGLAFKKDFGFSLNDFINVQQIMALWAVNAKKEEDTYYSATADEISSICTKEIKNFDQSKTESILEFLTLDPRQILLVKDKLDDQGNPEIQKDLPVWEHTKRLMRLDIRPLIKIDNQYFWGPHSIERTAKIWVGISEKHKLPSSLDAPNIKAILSKGHTNMENNLVKKIKEITLRYATNVEANVYPHKYDKTISDNKFGDYDVLAYIADKNILLNIESKIIDPPHSNKDAGRVQRQVFESHKSSVNGQLKKCDLEKVLDREKYLRDRGVDLMEKLHWKIPASAPKIISIFVTKIGFWWTNNPPINTEVKFVEIRLLDDFLKNI